MRVRLLYFATFRDVAGRDREDRQMAEGARVADLWTELVGEMPGLARTGTMPPAAVNREYTAADTRLSEGDEVAFLPPVAGG
ncbi:MAG TPA: MoaD/ThiS family protein [Thermoanaerobaculia bacterium]